VRDVFAMYSEISRAVSRQVAAKLTGEEQRGLRPAWSTIGASRRLRSVPTRGRALRPESVRRGPRAVRHSDRLRPGVRRSAVPTRTTPSAGFSSSAGSLRSRPNGSNS
jgi:hypothetical protein